MDSTSNRGSTGQLSSSSAGLGGGGGGGMHHSQSTPAGVDGGGSRTPPATPKKGGKMLALRVQMLDDTVTIFQVQAKALGRVLFDQVCKQLHLLEADYFGLEYADSHGTKYWLDLQKPLSRQLGLSLVDPLLYFCVKFYTPDPGQLEEEYTRYLFCLQVKRDLAQGLMQCNENTAALMASYIVQAECGDYVSEDYPDHTYLSSYKFVPQQDQEMERKIMENHKKHAGQSPAEADLNLLETARRCELYGMKMHPAKDHENVPLNLAVAHMGIIVFQQYTKINTFSWAKIRKISFKRKRFLIKLHPEGYGYYKDTVEFFFEGRDECKNFWKKCVENHGFFRCSSVKNVSRHKTRVLSRGSSFRYSGKTQKQIVEFVRDNYVKRQTFQRSASFRHSSAHSSASNMHSSTVGNSISAHPLLPLADSNLSVEVSKLSASLGSMGGVGAGRDSLTTRSASRHLGTATSWSSTPDTRHTTLPPLHQQQQELVGRVQTMTSPSPPLTTQSASPVTSATTSPLHMPYENHRHYANSSSSPVAVRAAVHRADTGTTITTIIHTTSVRMPSSHVKSEGALDQTPAKASPSNTTNFTNEYPSQTQSQNDLGLTTQPQSGADYSYKSAAIVLPKRHIWQRSASCRDLYDFSFEETGQAKRRAQKPKPIEKAGISLEERKLESPITRYDDHHAIYSTSSRDSSLEIHQDIMMPDQKVYSSSYPGTTSYSQESVEDPGNYDLRDSQDDISHDSYELLEKSDDDYSSGEIIKYKKSKPLNTRSCSLDSGNYMPSDSESETDRKHKCKSSSDVHTDPFLIEDPRDLPREIIPRKSDGSFYKLFKASSRTSSQESKSDYFESKSKSRESLGSSGKKRGLSSRTSSQESKSDYDNKTKTIRKNKSAENLGARRNSYYDSRTSSQESKSEYYDASSRVEERHHRHEYDRKISFERNYGIQKRNYDYATYPSLSNNIKETTHVHSISLQNVETEQNIRHHRGTVFEQNTVPRTQKAYKGVKSEERKGTPIWPEEIIGLPTEIEPPTWPSSKQSTQRSTESESNIFSFDEDRIQSMQESSDADVCPDHSFSVVPNVNSKAPEPKRRNYRDVFMEIEPRIGHDLPLHQPIERTKSDPNSLARQRLNSSSRRLLLMHQKSIDLTPAESSDEDYLYKQIPSAPPITKYKGTHFEMPTAEFGHFDILKREIEGEKTKFEVPKSQFEILGAKTQSDFINLPPKGEDIPYVLHKRHVMNGTSSQVEDIKKEVKEATKEEDQSKKSKPDSGESSFLFTQNIDLSKVDPVTLEIDKTQAPVQHLSSPKRDITHIDPILLEALNSKLSQIESDSPTSSKTESLKPQHKIFIMQNKKELKTVEETKLEEKAEFLEKLPKKPIKTDIKPKRIIKPRMQPGKKGGKGNKTKVRITSFSSDDESLDSDDVFGSAEATPTRMEFSPPQMRKEMESILKFESERKYLQYTMSSTEVEGSPPTTRKKTEKSYDNGLDPNVQTELRRISERSLSIPSSEDDFNIATVDLQPVFTDVPDVLKTVHEIDKEDAEKSMDETLKEDSDREASTYNEFKEREKEKLLDEEREREKLLLQAEIENDIKNLKVPPKTKITEITTPGAKKSQSPMLFAHARLNLSEGSAITLLQKQQAIDSPVPGRRAKSLDAPVIPISRLPPLNAFSSKDDTVEEESSLGKTDLTPMESLESTNISMDDRSDGEELRQTLIKEDSKENDQIVPDVTLKPKPKMKTTVQTKLLTSKMIAKGTKPAVSAKPKEVAKSKPSGKEKPALPPRDQKKTPPQKPPKTLPKSTTLKQPPAPQKALSAESKPAPKLLPNQSSLPTQSSLATPEIKRTKSQEIDAVKKSMERERTKSLEKLELKRLGSKERAKSQEESDTDIAKRKEKQQMLYEIAIKQTKTIKSPVKDTLPVFPQVEEMVRERHGKLEISINTIENTTIPLEEAIIITKSPKKLDKKMDKKLTKSLELNLSGDEVDKSFQRLGKSLDLDNREKEDRFNEDEFDFKPETILYVKAIDLEEIERKQREEQEASKDVHSLPETEDDKVILEGTSLDVWLSVDEQKAKKMEDITVIQKSTDFFEKRTSPKPPDLGKVDTKSSSDSQSLERVSLGNSLDMKYIDDSGESSHKSEQDAQLIKEMQRASSTVSKFIRKKLEKRKLELTKETIPKEATIEPEKELKEMEKMESIVRITSEDESLTEVSELKNQDYNLLSVRPNQKEALQKLSIERSRSEDTGSWMTVECEEFAGTESSLDYDNATFESPEKEAEPKVEDVNLLSTGKQSKLDLLKRSSDQSRSSDTTGSWTSGEKESSPGNLRETTDESSVSCSMGRAIGLSQTIEMFSTKDLIDKGSPSESEPPKSPRSPRMCVLGRTFTIDEGCQKMDNSSSEEDNQIPKDLTPIQELTVESEPDTTKYKRAPYPFEEKWSNDSELSQRLHKKLSKKLSSSDKSMDDSLSADGRRKNASLHSIEKLSTESRNSIDTESSSGSFGAACRMTKSGDIPKELSSTWKPFPLDSSGSESFDDNLLPPDYDPNKEYFLRRDSSGDFTNMAEVYYKSEEVTPTAEDVPEDIANFAANYGYANIATGIAGINIGPGFLSRTLSRISERSTNSEKSSVEEDSTKATTQSDSLNDESSSNPQASLSSESPSNAHVSETDKKTPTNEFAENKLSERSSKALSEKFENLPHLSSLLQRQISDDRRTSAEMAELSIDDIEIISERGLRLKRQGSDDTIIDEECFECEQNGKATHRSSSQESEEWPLPDIPQQAGQKPLLAMHEVPSSDTSQQTTQVFQPPRVNIPKSFGLRGSLKSQDSEQWPSPPSSVLDPPIVGNVETYYLTPPEEACKVNVESTSTYDNDSISESENKTLDLESEKTHTYENVPTEHISESISESLSVGPSGVKIVLDDKTTGSNSNSDDDLNNSNLNDDVFTDAVDTTKNELRPPTAMRRSTASDDSSHSRKKSSPKGSHSSYSEEEVSSSMGTNLEDGTVRLAYKPTKCTHSSHSEDTSIALSLSEWSNSTNTVKFQNLSSNSGTTKSSSGLKSDENSLTDIAQSISEWSSSNTSTLKAQQQSLQFQKLSSTTSTGDSTLTDLIPTISEWSSSDSRKTFMEPKRESINSARPSVSRLGSSIDVEDMISQDQKSPKNIPSEDFALLSTALGRSESSTMKPYTKSTERPIVIPVPIPSDTDSSIEQHRTVHTQRYDKDKQKYMQKTLKSISMDRKVPLKLSKCSPYYSSSLSSESTPLASTSPIPMSKTATVPLTRTHRKPISKSLYQAKSPPSENESTSSVESPKSKSERDRRGYRRRRQAQRQRQRIPEKTSIDEYYYVEHESGLTEYNEYIRTRNMEEMASNFQYEGVLAEDSPQYVETLEEGYYPDGDSQSGSDIFRMEREEEMYEQAESGFDVSSIPPPLLEDDFEGETSPQI